ncbi:MAG: hypothetical protein DLM50_00995 [Candidatus Meridianibacter frigidus]|nr:MAG: hypothetical protein DLM50_00995 [Candidatus Eremiobacteraeota bacterium]
MKSTAEDLVNPSNATAAELSRRGFVVIGAAAAAALSDVACARAQEYGKPHSPIVPEDDPDISVMRPELKPNAGTPIAAYAAKPHAITPNTPGLVVTQHIWGVDATIRDFVRRMAKNGYIAIAPLLYDRLGAPSGDDASDYTTFGPTAEKMQAQGFVSTDLSAGRDWIRTQAAQNKVGITGFCMGAGIVLKQIIGNNNYQAAAMFYGSVRPGTASTDPTTATTFDFTSEITTPLMGSFGARDTSIKPEDVRAMFARLTVPHDLKIYDEAGHAFMDDTRPSYVASAATDAFARLLAWFTKYLR